MPQKPISNESSILSMGNKVLHIYFLIFTCFAYGQTGVNPVDPQDALLIATDTVVRIDDPNKPAKAAFYSAVLPGLGQAYNKSAWKIPIIYGALGGGVYVFLQNDETFDRLRDAFKIRQAGGTNDEFSREDGSAIISTLGLERAQRVSQRNKELSLLITAAFYVLQIIEANVNAHLDQFNVDRNLSVLPYFDYNQSTTGVASGLSLSYTF